MKSPNPGGRFKGKEDLIRSIVDFDDLFRWVWDVAQAKVPCTMEDRKWAAKFLTEHGLGKAREVLTINEGPDNTAALAFEGKSDEEIDALIAALEPIEKLLEN